MSVIDANHEEDDDVPFTAQSSPTREKIFSTIQTPGTTEKKQNFLLVLILLT